MRSERGRSIRSRPFRWRMSKKNGSRGAPGGGAGTEPAHRLLEPPGQAALVEGEGFTVEHDRRNRQAESRLRCRGHAVGDLVEAAGEHRRPAALTMHLDAGAVHLPLH